MGYTYKSGWKNNVQYSVGDVVIFTDGLVYHLQKAAPTGTSCHDTLYWEKMSQELTQAILLIEQAKNMAIDDALTGKVANNLTTTASGKVLDARQGKALKTLVDEAAEAASGAASAIAAVYPDAKTLRLASSTADSTKIFDITVDDEGELTATEYTPPAEETPAEEET